VWRRTVFFVSCRRIKQEPLGRSPLNLKEASLHFHSGLFLQCPSTVASEEHSSSMQLPISQEDILRALWSPRLDHSLRYLQNQELGCQSDMVLVHRGQSLIETSARQRHWRKLTTMQSRLAAVSRSQYKRTRNLPHVVHFRIRVDRCLCVHLLIA
jgi:hypothetical protein